VIGRAAHRLPAARGPDENVENQIWILPLSGGEAYQLKSCDGRQLDFPFSDK